MQSIQLVERIQSFTYATESKEGKIFIEWLMLLNTIQKEMSELIGAIFFNFQSTNDEQSILQGARQVLGTYSYESRHKILNGIRTKDFFQASKDLQISYRDLSESVNNTVIIDDFITLEDAYEDYIKSSDLPKLTKLLNSAVEVFNSVIALKNLIEIINNNLNNNYEIDNTLNSFSLLLESEYTFKEFVDKLNAIQDIYTEICYIFGVSQVDFPLQIIKVESGSLWVQLFGEPKVIDFLLSILEGMRDFVYRNMTREGKIKSIEEKFQTVEAALVLREKMLESGISTDEFDEKIQKSSVLLVDKMNVLLQDETYIKVNGELLIPVNKTQKSLKGNKGYLLEGSKDKREESK